MAMLSSIVHFHFIISGKRRTVAGPDPNALMIEDAAAEEEERGSNSNRGSVDAEIAAAVDRRTRKQVHVAFQRTRE